MATTSETIYTFNCDLCGSEYDREKLTRLELGKISGAGSIRIRDNNQPECDVCQPCASKPVSDLLAFLAKAEEEAGARRFPY